MASGAPYLIEFVSKFPEDRGWRWCVFKATRRNLTGLERLNSGEACPSPLAFGPMCLPSDAF